MTASPIDSDELLSDLDSEVTADAITATPNSTQAEDMSELDALLADSMQAVAERNEVKQARERLRKGGYSSQQTALDNQLVQSWADRYEWQAVATVGVFNRYSCACGSRHAVFDCTMVEELHRHDKHTKRFINLAVERRAQPRGQLLTRRTIVREHKVEACDYCAHAANWSLAGAERWNA